MENKYFTPDKEDVSIGMEYYYLRKNNEFILFNLTEEDFRAPEWIESLTGRKQSIFTYLQEGKIKVAYLTKEQIEAEGWKHYGNNCFELNPRWFCSWYPEINRLEVYDNENEKNFAGKCKDINTFRKICKLLEI